MTIPRLIHQTWKSADLPESYRGWFETVDDLHPDHEHRLWTDEDNLRLITDRYPWFVDTYLSYAHDIERADSIRYFILYELGGVYLDLDMELLRPIDELIAADRLYFTLEAGPSIVDTVISNAFMAAPREHPFFERLISDLPGLRRSDVTFADVFNNTGPDMLASQVAEHGDSHEIDIIGLDRVCPLGVLAENMALQPPRDLETVRRRRDLYAIHHNTESWNVQRPHPDQDIAGYVLFRDHDLPGYDRAYVEVPETSFDPIVAVCDADPAAVGFNYNGFVKGRGARLERASGSNRWLKPGISPWVCVKAECVDVVR